MIHIYILKLNLYLFVCGSHVAVSVSPTSIPIYIWNSSISFTWQRSPRDQNIVFPFMWLGTYINIFGSIMRCVNIMLQWFILDPAPAKWFLDILSFDIFLILLLWNGPLKKVIQKETISLYGPFVLLSLKIPEQPIILSTTSHYYMGLKSYVVFQVENMACIVVSLPGTWMPSHHWSVVLKGNGSYATDSVVGSDRKWSHNADDTCISFLELPFHDRNLHAGS